jgi:hypothetical protein
LLDDVTVPGIGTALGARRKYGVAAATSTVALVSRTRLPVVSAWRAGGFEVVRGTIRT